MLRHNVLVCSMLLLGLLGLQSLSEARRVCKDHSRHCRQIGDKRPRFRCYRKSTQERCCATCRNFENPNNGDCLYGDKLAWCSSIGNRYAAVSCYTHEVECCETCGKLVSNEIKDCPYGDREIWCPYFTKEKCNDKASHSSCCQTCHHLLHGDTTHTHEDHGTDTESTDVSTILPHTAHPGHADGAHRNSTIAMLAVNVSRSFTLIEQLTSQLTTNHTMTTPSRTSGSLITMMALLVVKTSDSSTSSTTVHPAEVTAPTQTSRPRPMSRSANLSRVLPRPIPTSRSANLSRLLPRPRPTSRSVNLSRVFPRPRPTSRSTNLSRVLLPEAGAGLTALSVGDVVTSDSVTSVTDTNTHNTSTSSPFPTVTYRTDTGPNSRSMSQTSSQYSSSSSPFSSSTPSTLQGGVVTELRIKMQPDIPGASPSGSPSNGSSASYGHHLPNLEDDEDYAQMSGDDITIDDITEGRLGGHHHEDDRHHNGNHHSGGHHHKKGHRKNDVTQEVPYRYIPAEHEDYIFDDLRSSSSRVTMFPGSWAGIFGLQILVLYWAIMGHCLCRWVT